MLKKIQRLGWDSNFFGYEVGKLTIKEEDIFSFESFHEQASAFDLIYIFSNTKIHCPKFLLTDRKVILEKKNGYNTKEVSHSNEIRLFDPGLDSYDKLLDLGLQSGLYSRFRIDSNFSKEEYSKMYSLWTEKLLKDENSQIWVINDNGNIMGFIGFTLVAKEFADIVLVGVDQNFRGMGYGKKLLNRVLIQISRSEVEKIKVTTQLDNQAAMQLYQSQNFEISQITYIYHFWNK